MNYHVYDLEVLKNFFSYTGKGVGEATYYSFEISSRKNERDGLVRFLNDLAVRDVTMVGFNSLGFDYPILHQLLSQPYTFDYTRAYHLCQEIINGQRYGSSGPNRVKASDRFIKQLDLVKLNHFDNENKRVPLKMLQFNMRSDSIEDMPVEIGVDLTHEQMDQVLKYNLHDVTETEKFFLKCKNLVDLRLDLLNTGVLRGDVLNYSDVKIGQEYLISKIGRAKCFVKGSTPKQTIRSKICFRDVILPNIQYYNDEYRAVKEWFESIEYNVALKDKRPTLETTLAGLEFKFGLGGVHASKENKVYRSSDTHKILDVDVAGMYVAVGVANRFAPEHLGQDFTQAYGQLKSDRRQYAKGTSMNAVLKLAGNGVYGNSNNPFSVFFDPKYTYTVTINGQLQLLMLVERLAMIPGVEIIQANTDGITLYYPRDMDAWVQSWCKEWEAVTRLELEQVEYNGMWIRDVNNYIARTTKGKVKRKGAYWYPESWDDYEGQWSKDFSNMVVPKIASLAMLNDWNDEMIYASLRLHQDHFDFCSRYRAKGKSKIYIGDVEQQKTVRYYVSTDGDAMIKRDPPKGVGYKRKSKITDSFFDKVMSEIGDDVWDDRIHTKNKSKYTESVTGIEAGHKVTQCNNINDFNWSNVDYDYFFNEVKKLVLR